MSEEMIYTMTEDEMRRLRALSSQLHGGSDRERDVGHRLWLVIGQIEASGESAATAHKCRSNPCGCPNLATR
jgi:hypothetical protein